MTSLCLLLTSMGEYVCVCVREHRVMSMTSVCLLLTSMGECVCVCVMFTLNHPFYCCFFVGMNMWYSCLMA